MVKTHTQTSTAQLILSDLGTSLRHIAAGLVGRQQVVSEVSVAAAHFGGLIDMIERAGWDISRMERVRHAFDEHAQSLLAELLESYPDMSETEQVRFLTPFRTALHQFSHLSQRERAMLRTEYGRFTELHAQSLREYATVDAS
jgi:hypothetical protein